MIAELHRRVPITLVQTRRVDEMSTVDQRRLASFAARKGFTVEQSIALPEAVKQASDKCDMTESAFIHEMTQNEELADHIKSVCSVVMSGLRLA
jgi:hypothetical protein